MNTVELPGWECRCRRTAPLRPLPLRRKASSACRRRAGQESRRRGPRHQKILLPLHGLRAPKSNTWQYMASCNICVFVLSLNLKSCLARDCTHGIVWWRTYDVTLILLRCRKCYCIEMLLWHCTRYTLLDYNHQHTVNYALIHAFCCTVFIQLYVTLG